jgi:50S ribosomal protein L16 3-hydroxylase
LNKLDLPKLDLGMPMAKFLAEHWQRKPLLIPNAIANFQSPISPHDLAYLACRKQALARLIQGQGKRFKVQEGPFVAQDFAKLPKRNWTLLVQDVDKFDPEVRAILQLFSFLPSWRLEDIMVSYAVAGGSVGAHVDQYDVFLLQAAGHRRWQIDQSGKSPAECIPRAPLKLLQRFEPDFDQVLAPGDMLYLPPGVPHHGVALDDQCMTFSIGLRAPSVGELLENLAMDYLDRESDRLTDPALAIRESPAIIDQGQLSHVLAALKRSLEMPTEQFADWFGRFITGYRSTQLSANAKSKLISAASIRQRLSTSILSKSPELRVALRFDQRMLYVAGRSFQISRRMQAILSAFTVSIDQALFDKLTGKEQEMVATLLAHQVLYWQRR